MNLHVDSEYNFEVENSEKYSIFNSFLHYIKPMIGGLYMKP